MRSRFERAALASAAPWAMQAWLHRRVFRSEAAALAAIRRAAAGRRLVALNVAFPQFLEHLRDVWKGLGSHPTLAPLLIGPTQYPRRAYKEALVRFLEERYGLRYGSDVLPFPWLEGAALLLEVSVSRYGDGAGVPKAMYCHGLAGVGLSKDLADVRYLDSYRAVLLSGPLHRRALEAGARLCGGRLPPLHEVGYLRGDRLRLRQADFDRRRFLAGLELAERPLVLFAPTWGPYGALDEWLEPVIEACRRVGASLLLKPHPITLHGPGGREWAERLAALPRTATHARAWTSADVDDPMLAADVVVSEASGLALEFMTLGKPAVFLPAPGYFAAYGDERPEKWVRRASEPRNLAELARSLERALAGADPPWPLEELVYHPGRSLGRALAVLEALAGA